MAIPRVFISSTCYDLRYIRENLKFFIENMGFEPVLSERGNIFFDPKKNIHEACLAEVPTCQMFVLVIGGRLGSKFEGKLESITNYEYREAVKAQVPIFALVEQQVNSDNSVYQKNKDNPKINEKKIYYPSVDSILIFDFMEEVQGNAVNNALFPFSDYEAMESYLSQQWAGMMFSFLSQEGESKRVANMLDTLTSMSNRIEFLSKQILSSLGTDIDKITVEMYDIMLKYACIRDLAYLGIRPSPKEIIQTKDYKSLGKGKIKVIYDKDKGMQTISNTGELSVLTYEKNVEGYNELKIELLEILKKAKKKPEDL